jgi:hypothetical protein
VPLGNQLLLIRVDSRSFAVCWSAPIAPILKFGITPAGSLVTRSASQKRHYIIAEKCLAAGHSTLIWEGALRPGPLRARYRIRNESV